MTDTTTGYCFLAFLIVTALFLYFKTSVGPAVRDWHSRTFRSRVWNHDADELDHLLDDYKRQTAELLDTTIGLAKFMAFPPKSIDHVDRALATIDAARDHLLRLAAELDMGEKTVLTPSRSAAVVPLEKGARAAWVDGRLRPGGR